MSRTWRILYLALAVLFLAALAYRVATRAQGGDLPGQTLRAGPPRAVAAASR